MLRNVLVVGYEKRVLEKCMVLFCKDIIFYMFKNLKISEKEFFSYGYVCMVVLKCIFSIFYGMKLIYIFGVIFLNIKYDWFLKNLVF